MKLTFRSAALGLALAAACAPTWAEPLTETSRDSTLRVAQRVTDPADAQRAMPFDPSAPTPVDRLDTLPPATPLSEARGLPAARTPDAATVDPATTETSPLMQPSDPIDRVGQRPGLEPPSTFDSGLTIKGMPPNQ